VGIVFFALLLAVGLTACGKKSDTDVSSTTPEQNPATVAETPAPAAPSASESAPATPAPPATPPAKASTSTTTKHKTTPAAPAVAEKKVSAPIGTAFDVTLVTPIKTDSSAVGDQIEATLVEAMIVDNEVIANKGAALHGQITELTAASKDRSEEARASVKLAFTTIETVDGEKTLDASVTNVQELQAGGVGKRNALLIGGAAAAGAILGRVIGGDTKGAVVGAVAGAAVGTGGVLMAKGHELNLPAGTKISLKAEQPITIVSR
jgi:hypothetical protein